MSDDEYEYDYDDDEDEYEYSDDDNCWDDNVSDENDDDMDVDWNPSSTAGIASENPNAAPMVSGKLFH